MKRILITGSNGFVGKNLLKAINKNIYDVHSLDSTSGDLSKSDTWLDLKPCDYLVHLAAKTFVPKSWEEPEVFIRNNILSTTNALEFCRRNKTKLILLSSYMYGNPKTLPTPETHPLSANNPYGLSKLLSENISHFYNNCMGTNVIILRVFNLYGPGQPEHFLISQIISQLLNENKITVQSLIPKRDYLYIDDLSDAIIKALTYKGHQKIFNIGQGESHSVKEIIDIIKKAMNSNAIVINKNKSRKMEILETVADIKLAKLELKWEPRFNFEEGMQELLNNKI
tara:strand:+ start:1317 stop:2165 length:849 start_codon:yes stop_codon:yes gene_type:complete